MVVATVNHVLDPPCGPHEVCESSHYRLLDVRHSVGQLLSLRQRGRVSSTGRRTTKQHTRDICLGTCTSLCGAIWPCRGPHPIGSSIRLHIPAPKWEVNPYIQHTIQIHKQLYTINHKNENSVVYRTAAWVQQLQVS